MEAINDDREKRKSIKRDQSVSPNHIIINSTQITAHDYKWYYYSKLYYVKVIKGIA